MANTVSDLAVLAESDEDDETVETNSIDMGNFLDTPLPVMPESRSVRIVSDGQESARGESAGRKIWRVIYPVLLYFAITTVVSLVGDTFIGIVAVAVLGITEQEELMAMMMHGAVLLTGVGNLVAMPVLLRLIQLDERRRRNRQYHYKPRPEKKSSSSMVLGTILSAVALCQILNDLISLSGLNELFPGYEESSSQIFDGQSIFMLLAVVAIVSPIIEELVFRGLLQQRLRDYLGKGWAIGLTAVSFGAYHGNMVQFIYASLIGVFLGCALERTQDLRIPVAAHIAANFWSIVGTVITAQALGGGTTAILIADIIMLPVLGVGIWLLFFRDRKEEKE